MYKKNASTVTRNGQLFVPTRLPYDLLKHLHCNKISNPTCDIGVMVHQLLVAGLCMTAGECEV